MAKGLLPVTMRTPERPRLRSHSRNSFHDSLDSAQPMTSRSPSPFVYHAIEGGVNAQLRDVLRNHRGLKIDH